MVIDENLLKMKVKSELSILFSILLIIFSCNSYAVNYYLSTSGDDSNVGTSMNNPWKSLNKLNALVPKPGDSIFFKRGDEWNGTIAVNMWGFEGKNVFYGSYGEGPKPKIYGSEPIIGWTRHSGNIYKASIEKNITQLFVGNNKMKAARHPNSGYFFITNTSGTISLTTNELDASVNYTGAKWFGRTNYFTTSLLDVKISNSRTLTLNKAPRFPLKFGLGFFLMNKLEFLDQAGEWYFDEPAKTVYLWIEDGDSPENYNVRGSVHKDGLYISGKGYITISNIHFLQQAEKGIHLRNSDNIIIDNNEFSFADGYGIYSLTEAAGLTITNNTIIGVNHYGMYLRASNSLISDNNLSKIALFDYIGLTGTGEDNFGGGIYLAGVNGNNKVRYNRITETGSSGILFSKPNNIIEYNFIKSVCLLKSDMGGIYTSWYNRAAPQGPEGSIIRNNIILNVKGEKYGYTSQRHMGEGIYIDESVVGVTVENNTIAYCTNSGIKLHKTENTTIRNNLIFDTRQSIHILNSEGTGKNQISDNVMIVARTSDDYLKRQVVINESSGNALYEGNVYVNLHKGEETFLRGSSYCNFIKWKSLTGVEKNSEFLVEAVMPGEREILIFNDTKQDIIIDLGNKNYKDIKGRKISQKIVLSPFTSTIVIGKITDKFINMH